LIFSSASRSGGQLTVSNWVGTAGVGARANEDRILFASNADSGDFLANVFFSDYGTGALFIDLGHGQRELAPVAEPTARFAGCFVLGLLGWTERKRLRQLLRPVSAD
jgi:hypothetical protein